MQCPFQVKGITKNQTPTEAGGHRSGPHLRRPKGDGVVLAAESQTFRQHGVGFSRRADRQIIKGQPSAAAKVLIRPLQAQVPVELTSDVQVFSIGSKAGDACQIQ